MKLTDEDRAALVLLMGADIAKIVTHRHPRVEFYLAGKRAGAVTMRERAAKVADGYMPAGPSPIGPLHGAGIASACRWVAKAIRALEVDDER